jgi:hypothetical protein
MSLSDLLVQTLDGDAAGDDKNTIGESSDMHEICGNWTHIIIFYYVDDLLRKYKQMRILEQGKGDILQLTELLRSAAVQAAASSAFPAPGVGQKTYALKSTNFFDFY